MFLLFSFILFIIPAYAAINNEVGENKKKYDQELVVKQFSDSKKDFAGKIKYLFSLHGWQVEVLYRNGKSISETARPRGNNVKKEMITEKEANVIADILYPRKHRGSYRKQINNANFISHFFEHGVVSFEMRMDKHRKKHVGIVGVRTVLYSDGAKFKDIKVNAYH